MIRTLFVLSALGIGLATRPVASFAAEVSITMDDPNSYETPLHSPVERNEKILSALSAFSNLKAALFVCGMRVNNPEGRNLLHAWNARGHTIANHSYSHLHYNSESVTVQAYQADFLKGEDLIKDLSGFKKIFRFPYLKEGNTKEKIEAMRTLIKQKGYRNGHVSIDASDWYISQRLESRLRKDPTADTTPYRDFYLKHILNRAEFYNDLSRKVLGREIKHTLLVHHNLLNSLYLKHLLSMFQSNGWKLISPEDAYTDPVYSSAPQLLPAGESLIWALAKEAGRFEDILRYPAEDGEYEKAEMDRLGL